MTKRNTLLTLLASGVLLATGACKSETTPPVEVPETTAGAPAAAKFTVSDTFGALGAIHNAEIAHGKMAMQKATSPEVKAFAKKVVADHEARLRKDDELMGALGISPKQSSVSSQIKSAADDQSMRLDSMSGADFDRAYIDEQIKYYRMALDVFDKELLPEARDPQVRANLTEARARANAHLEEAQALRLSLINQ